MTQNRAIKYNKPKCPGRQRSEDTDIPRHAVNCTAKQKTTKKQKSKVPKKTAISFTDLMACSCLFPMVKNNNNLQLNLFNLVI